MRVIRINAVYGLSSTGRTVKQLDEGLKKYGVDSTTAYLSGPGSDRDLKMNTPNGVKLHSLMARLTGKAGYYSAGATKKLLKYLDEQKPDIVHLHNLHSNFIDLPMLFEYLSANRLPVVVTLHDCWWYTGKCTHYTLDGCRKWLSCCGSCPQLKKDIPSLFFDRTQKLLADKKNWFGSLKPLAVIGVSDWITNEAKMSFLGGADIIERVYNWIDTAVFKPTESDILKKHGLEGKKILLGVASQWMDPKGLGAFIELSHELPKDTALVLIGKMPGNEERDISNITIIPATESQEELARWYSAADVFITLSTEESFGKVTAEALACGTPVVAVNSTASPELVGKDCGVVIDDTEPKTVLTAARTVLAWGKQNRKDKCRAFALNCFDMEKNTAKTADLYRRLLEISTGGNE